MLGIHQDIGIGVFQMIENKRQKNCGHKHRLIFASDLGIESIKNNFKDFPSHYTRHRLEMEAGSQTSPLGRTKNPHDVFINLDGSIEMAVQSKKPKAAALVKWLSKKGVEKIPEEHQKAITDCDNQIQAHQQAIEEKDATISFLNDDLKNREYENVALQAQKDVY